MENIEKIAGLVLAIAAILSPIVTLWLGWRQSKVRQIEIETRARLDNERGLADDMLDLSAAAKNIGDNWKQIVESLRNDLERVKREADEREKKYLAELKTLRGQLGDNQSKLDAVMESEMKRNQELEEKLRIVTDENDRLHIEIVQVQGENLRLQTELNETREEVRELRVENDRLRETIQEIKRDVRGIKKQTGDLSSEAAKRRGDEPA